MLAYVFWHWPRDPSGRQTYEQRLREFQQALAAHPPSGFRSSCVFRLAGAPWLEAPVSYEEWYLSDGSAALDPLNDAAVAPACRQSHDAAARLAGGGAAGLYRLRAGRPVVAACRSAAWLAKPSGMAYPDLFSLLEPLSGRPEVSLWGRQMVLGPTPEFCLLAPAPVALPAPLSAVELALDPLWP